MVLLVLKASEQTNQRLALRTNTTACGPTRVERETMEDETEKQNVAFQKVLRRVASLRL